MTRRTFLASTTAAAAASTTSTAFAAKEIPLGLELYSVRNGLIKDPMGTVRAVVKAGYPLVEFYATYFDWPLAQIKDMRKLMDDLGMRCRSTHNDQPSFTETGLPKAIERNQILGAQYIVMASAGTVKGLEGWKKIADRLSAVSVKLKAAGLNTGYHNHKVEFDVLEGRRPIEIVAEGTPKEVMLQFDVGTCVEAGSDPVAWIEANPGRIRSMHCKDWAAKAGKGPDAGYKVLFGEGDCPWKQIFAAAESMGGVEYYLMEQEGSRFGELETVERCLANWKKLRG